MTNKKNKKTARQKRTLVLALLVAATIAAGSTFAWFTSKDEVTNRLSASAKYDVSIAEDFQPPEEWLPGQKINKDVAAVNTGNVDAFVRMWLGGQMRLLAETNPSVDARSGTPTAGLDAVTDADKVALGLTYSDGTMYYRTLSTEKIDNPNDHASPQSDSEDNVPAQFSEVQSMMAGGVLVYAPDDADYTWELEQATEMKVGTFEDNTVTNVAQGTLVGSENSDADTKIAGVSADDSNYYGAIDASTFTPKTPGLYLFRRNAKETEDGLENTYEYSGYYYCKINGKDVYFALHTGTGKNGHSDYVLPEGAVTENTAAPSEDLVLPVTVEANKVFLYTASEQVIDTGSFDTDLIWAYDADNSKFTVTYKGADSAAAATKDDVVIDIALSNISEDPEAWTAIGTANDHTTTFYYNNDVEAGDTTTKLVDSVTLSKDTDNAAYLAFDFDLNVFLESVQVTMDEAGNELLTPVEEWTGVEDENTGASATDTTGDPEIEMITWQ